MNQSATRLNSLCHAWMRAVVNTGVLVSVTGVTLSQQRPLETACLVFWGGANTCPLLTVVCVKQVKLYTHG